MAAEKAYELVAADLRGRILGGELAAGDTLPNEGELIDQLGVSRETVRVALRMLGSEGLLEVRRGRGGIRVTHPDPERASQAIVQLVTLTGATWRHLHEFRKIVEPAAASLAAEVASPAERAALVALADRGIGDAGEGYREFHSVLAAAADNPLLAIVLAVVEDAVQWAVALTEIAQLDVKAATISHRAIAQAINDGDAERAAAKMRHHLAGVEEHGRKSGLLDDPIAPPSRWLEQSNGLDDGRP